MNGGVGFFLPPGPAAKLRASTIPGFFQTMFSICGRAAGCLFFWPAREGVIVTATAMNN
jgi:hypothetical protein